MSIFFTSDTHLGHANIIKYCKRPFLSPDEQDMLKKGIQFTPSPKTVKLHDTTLIDRINARVGVNDTLWHLGDFCWGDKHVAREYLHRINCQNINFLIGNHDAPGNEHIFRNYFMLDTIKVQEQDVVLCHYPLRVWDRSHHGSWHLYGHVHGNLSDIPHLLSLDVGVDTHDFFPWSWEEICTHMNKRIPAFLADRATWMDKERGGMSPGTHG